METIKKPFSIKLIYWITNATFWLYCAVSVIGVIIAVALMFNLFGDLQLHTGVPVAIDVLEQGELNVNNTTSNVEFVEMYGKIHYIDTHPFIGRIYSVFILAILSLFLYVFLIFRKFINNVYRGIYFDVNNIAMLKKISYTLVGVWGFTAFYAYFQYFYIVKNIEFNSITINGNVETYPIILLVALFIWVLSHIFVKGCKLQEDNNYTI